jgi:hypothetical protein
MEKMINLRDEEYGQKIMEISIMEKFDQRVTVLASLFKEDVEKSQTKNFPVFEAFEAEMCVVRRLNLSGYVQ